MSGSNPVDQSNPPTFFDEVNVIQFFRNLIARLRRWIPPKAADQPAVTKGEGLPQGTGNGFTGPYTTEDHSEADSEPDETKPAGTPPSGEGERDGQLRQAEEAGRHGLRLFARATLLRAALLLEDDGLLGAADGVRRLADDLAGTGDGPVEPEAACCLGSSAGVLHGGAGCVSPHPFLD